MQVATVDHKDRQRALGSVGLNHLVVACIVVVAAGILYRATQSDGFYWLDDYAHLNLSRHAWGHPATLLDVWGRPLMTFVYLPAAQLGDAAARLTSLMIFAATAVFCGLLARSYRSRLPAAAALLLLAQPLAARLSFSAMTQT